MELNQQEIQAILQEIGEIPTKYGLKLTNFFYNKINEDAKSKQEESKIKKDEPEKPD